MPGPGNLDLTLELFGELISASFNTSVLEVELSLLGKLVVGQLISVEPLELVLSIGTSGSFIGGTAHGGFSGPTIGALSGKANWVKWSKIGHLNFDIDQTNVAGERPLDWKGDIYDMMRLGPKTIVAYGQNGITTLIPIELSYGIETIYRLGTIGKGAVAGTQDEHYFIDSKNRLFQLTQKGLKLIDYSEFIETLTNPRLYYDKEFGLLYICDGVKGFVYSSRFESFGSGPVNITGIGVQNGDRFSIAPSLIITPKFHIRTDIYDLGTRKPKTIQTIEIGSNQTDDLFTQVETRVSNKCDFINTPWVLVNQTGIAYIPCYGLEFRFHIASYINEYIKIDYVKIAGQIHQFSSLESIQ